MNTKEILITSFLKASVAPFTLKGWEVKWLWNKNNNAVKHKKLLASLNSATLAGRDGTISHAHYWATSRTMQSLLG